MVRRPPKAKVFDVELELGLDEALSSTRLPGFSLAVEELFGRGERTLSVKGRPIRSPRA